MYPARSQLISQGMPPLPPATMVIDMRGKGEDIISMLAAEIRNLTEEMKRQNINFWSSLADIISFIALDPIADENIASSPVEGSTQDDFTDSPSNGSTAEAGSPDESFFEHILDQASWRQSHLPTTNRSQSEEQLSEPVPPHPDFAELPHKIDLLRNARIRVRSNLGRNGIARYNLNEEVARVIFLTDASNYKSLFSTATCATYLKDYYRRFERSSEGAGIQSIINISVLCLNHEGTDQDTAPEHLIKGLSWEGGWQHLDALLLIERYRRDMAQMDTDTQNLFAEQLLYVLLTVSPSLSQTSSYAYMLTGFKNAPESTDKQKISLPPNTYLVGLSSIENSSRWGYRLLNYGLAERALQVLREDNEIDRQDENLVAKRWLNELRNKVRGTLSEMLPAHIPDLRALSLSMKAASPARGVFSNTQLGPKQGERSIRELEQYLSNVATTYTSEAGSSASQQPQTVIDESSRLPTLENAVLSIPKMWDMLNQWDGEDPEMPLAQAQISAYRVLAHPNLFRSPRGAIAVAKRQLKELADAIVKHEEERQQNPIDVKARKEALEQLGQDQINDLKNHVQRWPFLAAFLRLKTPMAWAATILMLLLCFILVVLGFAWLEQLVGHSFPSASRLLNLPLFGISALTWFHILFVLALATLAGISMSFFGRFLLEQQRSAFSVEIIFDIILVAIAFSGLITWLSYGSITAPAARTIILWYPTTLLLSISAIAFLIALAVIIIENIFYFSWWKKALKRKQAAIVETIRGKHQGNVEEVKTYMVDALTLRLLKRAGLVPDQTGISPYYRRIDELDRLLINTLSQVEDERRLADSRLSYEVAKTSPYIREELLDVAALKNGYWRWREAMDNKMNEFRELSVMLLRAMGEEKPGTIERQFRENASSGNSEPHYVQTLTGMLTAVALRLSTTMPSTDMLPSLVRRYEELDKRVIDQYSAPRSLIEAINKKMRAANLTRECDVPLAVQALVAWGQTIWEKKDPQLSSILAPGSVISRLIGNKRDPQTVIEELRMRASPSGRSPVEGHHGGLYLFVSPSTESRTFLKDVTLAPCITGFPDPECLLMLYIQYFVARPLVK